MARESIKTLKQCGMSIEEIREYLDLALKGESTILKRKAILEHNGRFNSRDYDKFKRMELMESPVRDAIHELKIKTYSLETLAQRFDIRLLGRGKHAFARLDASD